MRRPRAPWLAAPLLAACQSPAPLPAPVDEAALLLAADCAFAAQALEVGAAEAFHRFVTDDALQLPAAGDPVRGRNDIRESIAAGPPALLSWQPQSAEVSADASLGWTWGTWQAHEPGAGGRRLARGKYVNVWRRQPDGSWRVRLDMGNTAPEPKP